MKRLAFTVGLAAAMHLVALSIETAVADEDRFTLKTIQGAWGGGDGAAACR